MQSERNARIDRFASRELSRAEGRELAQQALEDADLFEELTAVALAQAALEAPVTKDRAFAEAALEDEDLFDRLVAQGAVESSLQNPAFRAAISAPPRRKRWMIAIAVPAAAAAGLLAAYFTRTSPPPVAPPATQARAVAPKPTVTPTLGSAHAGQPVLLASNLSPAALDTAVFRGAEPPSRPPKSEGTIVSVEDGLATVNLGSLDGLAKGTELPVLRDREIGRIVISTVFRERARGKVDGDLIRANDRVRVPNTVRLAATLQQVNALAASGDLKGARDVARSALAAGSSGETRQLLERLAALDYQAGAQDAARVHYEAAMNNFFAPPAATASEQATTWNALGALYMLTGDPQSAERPLTRAAAESSIDAGLRSEIWNNLGALAEVRGDQAQASGYYSRALDSAPNPHQRQIVEANLARVQSAKHP
jgi:Tfp pilus assembly protein PilF